MRRITAFIVVSSLLLFASSANAAICLIPFLCSSTSSATETATSSDIASAGPTSSNNAPLSSSVIPITSSSLPAMTTSSAMPIASSSPTIAGPTPAPTDSSGSAIMITASSSVLPWATSTPTASNNREPTKTNNLPIIIGSVCGFVALLIIGFAYAFFSRTRRNKKKQRLYSENGDSYEYGHYDIPNTAPAAAAAAAAAATTTTSQWNDYNGYTSSPQLPLSNEAYYASPQMNYVDSNYYSPQPMYHQPHYQPYEQQPYEQQPYEQQQPQQQQYQQQHQLPPPSRITQSNVYSPPNSYPEDHKY